MALQALVRLAVFQADQMVVSDGFFNGKARREFYEFRRLRGPTWVALIKAGSLAALTLLLETWADTISVAS
jgi:hypothetical protein